MKKIVIALLCLAMLCTLFACSSPQDAASPDADKGTTTNTGDTADTTDTEKDTADQEDTSASADSDIVIGFANLTDTLDYGKTVKAGVLAAAEERGWEVIALDNERTGSKAVENATTLVTRGVDAIIEFNVDAAVAPTIMEIVNNAGIPIICIDIPHEGAPYYGIDNYGAGYVNGQALAAKAEKEWGGEVDLVILVENAKAGEDVKLRMTGQQEAIQDELGLPDDMFIYVDGEGDLLKAQEVVTATLTAHPDKEHILIGTLQDPMGQGSLAAVEAAGRQDQVWIASIGAEIPALTNLRGEPNCWFGATAGFPEKYGEQIMPLVEKLINGEEIPDENLMEHIFIDKDNIDEYYPE